jgi:hypothetical protein
MAGELIEPNQPRRLMVALITSKYASIDVYGLQT